MSDAAAGDRPARLVVVISGRGRNLEALIEAIDSGRLRARIVLVISSRADVRGLRIARLAGLPCAFIDPGAFSARSDFDRALAARIGAESPDWVVLAGYMRILGSAFVQRFEGRLVNIHPSLLPKHKGLHTHRQALAAGDRRHGASVHFVTPALDDGPLIRQASIAIRDDDDEQRLAERLMHRVEQRLYARALAELIDGVVVWKAGRIWRDGKPQEQCPHDDFDVLTA